MPTILGSREHRYRVVVGLATGSGGKAPLKVDFGRGTDSLSGRAAMG